jgi:hypothetical protein
MVPASATPIFGLEPGGLIFLIIFFALLVVGGLWADRVDRRNPR